MNARLIVETGLAVPPVCELQPRQIIRLGRNHGNTIVINDRHASRKHAELYADHAGNWFLRDCVTTNGTRVNGERVLAPIALREGSIITIGDARLRFSTTPDDGVPEDTDEIPSLLPGEEPHVIDLPADDSSQTTLQADELTALFRFMTRSLEETTPHGLVKLALDVVLRQTHADTCGFLGLDAEEPEFRLVLPVQATVNTHLSRRLTEEAQREGRTVWLDANRNRGGLDSESLLHVHDAICIPLKASKAAEQPADRPEAPLGALHVYKAQGSFRDSEVRFCEVLAGCLANTLLVLRSRRALEADNSRLRVRDPGSTDGLIGDSKLMAQVRDDISRLASSPCSVLIVGESGVGKELAALALHKGSRRAAGPMVPVNCAAITANIPESELFGHMKGAFTGATEDRPGYFLQADEGTLFLDEIGELSLDIQAKLLRVLETKRFRPVGGKADVNVDVRVLAATNRDLKREVREGRFRKDLFFRLVATLEMPPLREHPEDIPDLAEHFLQTFAVEYHRHVRLSDAAMQMLQSYSWPGNVRQLRCVLETSLAMTRGDTIHASDLRLSLDSGHVPEQPASLNLEELEIWAIRQALIQTRGNNSQAARILGINRDTLINKMKKYNIDRLAPAGEV